MGATSTASKNKYNKKTYENFNVRLKPELFNKIDNYCKENGLSRSQFLEKAIETLKNKQSETKGELIMKKYFAETNGYNMMIVTDDTKMIAFDCETLEEAKSMDCSAIEGETDIEYIAHICSKENDIVEFNEDDYENLIYIGDL